MALQKTHVSEHIHIQQGNMHQYSGTTRGVLNLLIKKNKVKKQKTKTKRWPTRPNPTQEQFCLEKNRDESPIGGYKVNRKEKAVGTGWFALKRINTH